MTFIPRKAIKEFEADGKKVRLRYPKKEDLDQFHKYINTIIRERTFIGLQKPISRNDEIEWFSKEFKKMEKEDVIRLVAEVGEKFAGSSSIERKELDVNRHIGILRIGMVKDFRGMGIGKEMVEILAKLAKKDMGIRMIESSYYGKNTASEKLHKRLGFREIGRIPKGCNYYGKYYDEIIMIKEV